MSCFTPWSQYDLPEDPWSAEAREREQRRQRTPVAAALIEEGHAALERTLDEGLRRRIEDALSVVGFAMGTLRDVTQEEAAVIRRLFEQAT